MKVRFPCGDITLEGEWHSPAGEGPFPAVVVCHPYPPLGGSMDNSVVVAICEALFRQSIAAFRFNFRGVGGSEGSFGEGIGERDDTRAALDFVLSSQNVDTGRIGLAGYSFGAMMALGVALSDERVKMLALSCVPLGDDGWEKLEGYSKPKLYLIGDNDQMLPIEQFRRHTVGVAHPEQYQVIEGADHSMFGYENELARRVAEFFTTGFNTT